VSAALAPARRRRPARRGVQAPLFAPEAPSPRLDAPPTLDDVISRGWEGLAAGVAMACPVCGGELAPDHGGGRCESCGCTLS
jgi:hypothetical protein